MQDYFFGGVGREVLCYHYHHLLLGNWFLFLKINLEQLEKSLAPTMMIFIMLFDILIMSDYCNLIFQNVFYGFSIFIWFLSQKFSNITDLEKDLLNFRWTKLMFDEAKEELKILEFIKLTQSGSLSEDKINFIMVYETSLLFTASQCDTSVNLNYVY